MTDVREMFPAMRTVELDAVERELDNMWREVNANIGSSGGQAFSRNSVLTLVVFTQSNTHAQQVLGSVHALAAQNPSRVIIIVAAPENSGTAITTHIGTYVADATSCYSEDIIVEAQTDAVRHLPGVVLPLIVSGLPSFLWWLGEPPWGTELIEALVDGCDRFIVDTSEMSNVASSVVQLDDLMRRKKSRCAVGDICWTAQVPWRELVAQFFDPPNVAPYLENVERLVLEYAAGDEDAPVNSSQASLFAGWLASRLGWRVHQTQQNGLDASREYTLYSQSDVPISVELNARFGVPQKSWWDRPVPPATNHAEATDDSETMPTVRHGALMSVYLASRGNGQVATFNVARERDLLHATTLCRVPGEAMPSKTVHLRSVGEQSPLKVQLEQLGHDSVYEEALSASAQMLRTSLRKGRG